jgi:hypothetical protein
MLQSMIQAKNAQSMTHAKHKKIIKYTNMTFQGAPFASIDLKPHLKTLSHTCNWKLGSLRYQIISCTEHKLSLDQTT